MKRILAVVFGLLLLAATAVHAQFDYLTNADGATISVIGYYGASGYPVIIPASSTSLPVTRIGPHAFSGIGLTGVTIPGSVTSIGDYAF